MPERPNGRSDAEKVEARLPGPVRGFVRWTRQGAGRWLRVPLGLLFVAGGVLGFLPILGFWMLPLGLLLLAEDYPPLQRLLRRGMVVAGRWWRRLRRRWSRNAPRAPL